jgi:hypothetical protein
MTIDTYSTRTVSYRLCRSVQPLPIVDKLRIRLKMQVRFKKLPRNSKRMRLVGESKC